mgnify:CR=1 FL=1
MMLTGMGIMFMWMAMGNHNECRFGVNLGVGAEFALSRNWAMNLEFKYQLVSDFDQGVINIGAAYRF